MPLYSFSYSASKRKCKDSINGFLNGCGHGGGTADGSVGRAGLGWEDTSRGWDEGCDGVGC